MTSAEKSAAFALAVPSVSSRHWIDGNDTDPPRLEVRLSNGAYLTIGFDTDYWHRLIWYAPNASEDFESATAEMTGLSPDVLSGLCDEVEQACRAFESNWRAEYMADEHNRSDR